MTQKIRKTDEQWRQELDPDRFAILRCAATEPPWSGDLNYVKEDGVFRCGASGGERDKGSQNHDQGFSHCLSPLRSAKRYLRSAAAKRIRTTMTSSASRPINAIIPVMYPSIMIHFIQPALERATA